MKDTITILIIDDKNQSNQIKSLRMELKQKCNLNFISIQTTDYLLRAEETNHLDLNKLKTKLSEEIHGKHINWAFTDFNLAEDNIDGLDVAEILNSLRPNIKIIMYSGDRDAIVKKIMNKKSLNNSTGKEVIDAVIKLLKYNIIDYVRRDDYSSKIVELVNNKQTQTIEEYFLEQLRLYSDLEFKSCYAPFKGKKLGEIADLIESKSDFKTNDWIRELVEQAIAYLVKIQ